jgi:hypothetical protein
MAVLTQSEGRQFRLFKTEQDGMPPKGTHVATIIEIKDEFGVERPKFENREQTERVDLTAFLFGFRDENNKPWKVDSRPMRISANEKSALYGFLKSLTGEAPRIGWDYCELKGRKVLLTLEHRESGKGTKYASIAAISPLPKGYDPVAVKLATPPPPNSKEPDFLEDDDESEIPF